MAEFNFTTLGTAVTVLDSHLNSLATETGALPATAIDNSDGDFYADWAFNLTTIDLSAQSNPAIFVYFLSSISDGTTYETGSASYEPAERPDVIFQFNASNQDQYVIERLIITPHDFKPLLFNKTGVALASTGNTLSYAEYSTESN